MVHKVDKYAVFRRAVEHLLARRHAGLLACENLHERFRCHLGASVIYLTAFIHIHRVDPVLCRLIEQLAWERVLLVRRDVIVHHQDHILCRDAMAADHVVRVAAIGLVAVVLVASRADHDHSPVLCMRQSQAKRSHRQRQEQPLDHRGGHLVFSD